MEKIIFNIYHYLLRFKVKGKKKKKKKGYINFDFK